MESEKVFIVSYGNKKIDRVKANNSDEAVKKVMNNNNLFTADEEENI